MFKIFEKSANYTKNTERFHKIQNKIFRRRQLCNSATDRLSCCPCKRRLCIEHCRGLQRIYVRWAEENNKTEWIQAFFGSLEEKQKLVGSKYDLHRPSDEESYLDHGYDENKPLEEQTPEDLKKAAEFRGGEYLGGEPESIYTPVKWKCAFGHTFSLSVNAALHGGHWRLECMKHAWAYPKIAQKNPFYAQVWNPQHSPDETYEIPMRFSAYEIKEALEKKLGL